MLKMNKYVLGIIVAVLVFGAIKEPSWSVWAGALLFILLMYSMTFTSLQKIDYDDFGKYHRKK